MSNAHPCAEKIFINLNTPPAFQLRQKILGDNNANLNYIINETKARVTLRGRGSGFAEQNGAESNEPLYLMIEHQALKNLQEAKTLTRNLIETIQQDLQIFLQMNQQTVQIQQHHNQQSPIIQTSQQQITIPQAVLSCPPPTIIQQPTHIIQQQNFIPQHIPMQIIQQTPPPNTGIPIRTPIVQFQGQATSLQQANIQLQSANGGQQIHLLNQAPGQQFQLQYIPSTNQITNAQQVQTIQHVIQPQQQIQGIIQQPGAGGQQFITVQGNHFMIPPPNIIQHTQPQAVFNSPPTLTLKPEELKNDGAAKHDEANDPKNDPNMQQMATRILTNIPLNQPPPILNCPPPQIFNQQAPQQIQQFVVNTNAWPQQQQLQQLPLNSQIQIVTQPQAIRNGNEIVIQNPTQSGQQVFTTFNSQQQQQQFQQIQFHQATITQPPPSQPQIQNIHNNVQSNQQSISFQQQFEQKINQSIDPLQQLRAGKRKFDGESDVEANKAFTKTGMGPNTSDRSSPPKAKTRMMPSAPQTYQQPPKNMNVNNSGMAGPKNVQNKPMFPRMANPLTVSGAPPVQKNVVTTVESKANKSTANSENESSESNEIGAVNHFVAQNPNFMMRSSNPGYRFQGSQSFIHQQPPPIAQNSQFQRGQMMVNSNMNAYQNVGPSQMMQPPPPVTTTHQFIQQDMNVFQHNNFHTASQQGNMNPPQQQGPLDGEVVTANYQQQQRFRQW